MITILVSFIVSIATTSGLYYILHKANPTATQAAIDSVKAEVETAVTTEASAVKTDIAAKL